MNHSYARALSATYICAFFSLSMAQMVALSVPLWGGSIGLSVAMMGLVMSSRSVLPLVYSIHIGALMDALGVRRLLVGAALLCTVLPLLHPLLPFAPILIVLQIFLGLASSTCWLAAQASIGRLAGGEKRHTALFAFVSVAGLVVGPLLFGFIWEGAGPLAGFVTLSLWGSGTFFAALMLPGTGGTRMRRMSWRILLPQPASYIRASALILRPVGAFLVIFTLLRMAGITMQETFYPVLLQAKGLPPSVIGMLLALGNIVSLPASLLSSSWARLFGSDGPALAAAIAVLVTGVSVAPAMDTLFMLMVATVAFGVGTGLSMPIILSMLSSGLDGDEQGIGAGIRATANRMAAVILPVCMGLIAEIAGIAASFWIVGGTLLFAAVLAGYVVKRHPSVP